MEKEGKIYDVIIIGAGPAGLTAALYAVRDGLKTLLISKTLGGTANSIINLENWPGYKGAGIELMKNFYEQLKDYPIEVIIGNVQSTKKKGREFFVKTFEGGEFGARTLILATGTKIESKIAGEEKFVGKGISYCATCDAFFFRGKITAIIVDENSGIDEISTLANLAQKVYVICRKNFKLKGHLKKFGEKVETVNNAAPIEIKGKDKVESLIIKNKKEEKEINLDGIFIEKRASPLVEFTKKLGLKINKNNFIIVDDTMKTSVHGVFAAGDITNSKIKGVLPAAARGEIAAKNAGEFLQEK